METFLIKALQLVVALALLVIVHEFGHYFFARLFGIRVEKFYLFFNPWFSIMQYDPEKNSLRFFTYTRNGKETQLLKFSVGRDRSGDAHVSAWRKTIYGIGWVPLGGYCKIAGMIDESMDKEQLAKPAQNWEFRARPAYQRLLVMIGGVLFNFIAAVIIYIGIACHWGQKYVNFEDAYEGFDYVPAALEAGFRNGDIPLSADGRRLLASDPDYMLRMAEAKEITVLRNHTDTVTIFTPEDFLFRINEAKAFMAYRLPVVVAAVLAGQPAADAGLEKGDRIIAVDTVATPSFTELNEALALYADKPTTLRVLRNNAEITLTATPTSGGKLGFQLTPIDEIYPTVTENYTLLQSIPKGWELGTTTLGNYVGSMKHLFTREGAQSIGGFGAIGGMFPEKWNWLAFWNITAFLSLALAFMNIIPIPALDGGHVMFLLWEVITRRKPSDAVLEYAQYVGMAFLLALLLYANGMDLIRAFL